MRLSFRPMWGLCAAALAALSVLIALGVWQLERREEKLALIEQARARMTAPPVPLAEALRGGAESAEFKQVRLSGAFLPGAPVYEYARQDGVPGYRAIAPFKEDGGAIVLAERGFAPAGNKDAPPQTEGAHMEWSGTVRLAQRRNWFTPEDDVANRVFYARDPEAMAKVLGVAAAYPVIVSRETLTQVELSFSNPHLGYAMTWFGLAVVLVTVVIFLHRSRGLIHVQKNPIGTERR